MFKLITIIVGLVFSGGDPVVELTIGSDSADRTVVTSAILTYNRPKYEGKKHRVRIHSPREIPLHEVYIESEDKPPERSPCCADGIIISAHPTKSKVK